MRSTTTIFTITIINIIYYAWDDILQSSVCRNHRVWAEDLESNSFISCTLSDAADAAVTNDDDDDGEWTSASNNYHTHTIVDNNALWQGREMLTARFFNGKGHNQLLTIFHHLLPDRHYRQPANSSTFPHNHSLEEHTTSSTRTSATTASTGMWQTDGQTAARC